VPVRRIRLLWLGVALAASAEAVEPPCPGGRFAVDGEPLLQNLGGAADVIEIAGGQIAIESGCGTAQAKQRASELGAKLSARWKQCTAVPGPVKLKASFDPTCQTLTGTVVAAKAVPRIERAFTASIAPIRQCDYVPGVSEPAVMPPEVVNPPPPPPLPAVPPPPDPTGSSALKIRKQLRIFERLWSIVFYLYVNPGFNGVDWNAQGHRYDALIQQGYTTESFHAAMATLVQELKDEHSFFLDPAQVKEEELALSGHNEFVGIGVFVLPFAESHRAAVIGVFPGSPAAQLGLRPHDLLLQADGVPIVEDDGEIIGLGPEGSSYALTWQRLGEDPRTDTVTRRRISGFSPMPICRVPGTQVGYVQMNTFFDETIDDRLRAALRSFASAAPLDGLVLDLRLNNGGSSTVALPVLDLFEGGNNGRYVGRTQSFDLTLNAEDLAGSQTMPLVILADRDSVSFGEVVPGVLQRAGRATVVGGKTAGNVEVLSGFDFKDKSQAWIATFAFQPVGLLPGAWEGVGIQPDESVPTRWDLFTEETDPALARAVDVLQEQSAASPSAVRQQAPVVGPGPVNREPSAPRPVLRSAGRSPTTRDAP
jgi:carboxyl-terminal processing protease